MGDSNDWKVRASALAATGALSWRRIAKSLGVSKSTCSDYLRSQGVSKSTEQHNGGGKTHLFIPDSQVKPGVSLAYLNWIGQYICRKLPDVIVHAGDFGDMPSLSSYDKGKRTAEGKRVQDDINSVKQGMQILLAPLRKMQAEQREKGEKVYSPRLVLTLGNHEDRITRHVDANPELHGFLGIDSLGYKEAGWEVVDYLKPIVIDGVAYCHYFTNAMTGKPLGGNALNMLKTLGTSFTQGHKQCVDVATRSLPATGQTQWGLTAGACYEHQEDYKGMHNDHWKGIILKHNVKNGAYDPLFISLDWLKRTYGEQYGTT